MDLDPPDMGSYSSLLVTIGLSSTVNPQCTDSVNNGVNNGFLSASFQIYLKIALMLRCLACVCVCVSVCVSRNDQVE